MIKKTAKVLFCVLFTAAVLSVFSVRGQTDVRAASGGKAFVLKR